MPFMERTTLTATMSRWRRWPEWQWRITIPSFSQTYLRNAYNNGFLCIEVPELVKQLRVQFEKEIAAKEKTIIPGGEIGIEFTSGVISWGGERFTFLPLGSVPQSLVIAQGVENLVAKRLGLA